MNNTIGNIPFVPLPVARSTSSSAQTVSVPRAQEAPATLPTKNTEEQRYEVVKQAAQQVANLYVLGDQRFSIYKDTTGQYIVRYTSLRDGKVTYIPEPQLLQRAKTSAPVNISV